MTNGKAAAVLFAAFAVSGVVLSACAAATSPSQPTEQMDQSTPQSTIQAFSVAWSASDCESALVLAPKYFADHGVTNCDDASLFEEKSGPDSPTPEFVRSSTDPKDGSAVAVVNFVKGSETSSTARITLEESDSKWYIVSVDG